MLDLRSIAVATIVASGVCTLLIIILWRQNRDRFDGLGYLSIDLMFQTLGLVFVSLRNLIPDWISIVVSNGMIIIGFWMGYIGLQRFTGIKSHRIVNLIVVPIFIAAIAYYAIIDLNLNMRSLALCVGLGVLSVESAWLLVVRVDRRMRSYTLPVGLLFGVLSLQNLIRVIIYLLNPQATNDYLHAGSFETMMMIANLMIFIMLTYGLSLMVNRRLEMDIRFQEEKFSKAFHSSPYAVMLSRLTDGMIIEVNDGFVRISGYDYREVIGRTVNEMGFWVCDEDRERFDRAIAQNKRLHGVEQDFKISSGRIITGLVSAELIDLNNQAIVISTINDITEQKRMEERIREISIRDPLTNLFNRRYLFERFETVIAEFQRLGIRFSVSLIDLDHFKLVNDRYGHQTGDYVLLEFSRTILHHIRIYDIPGRYGGEEFLIISIHSDKRQTLGIIERIRRQIKRDRLVFNHHAISYSFSCGIADCDDFRQEAITAESIISKADRRLYMAKLAGRDRIVTDDQPDQSRRNSNHGV
ncbi:MAG: GGDEF domain-containing protein [Candidatus Delongbacteria bacterium]|nr:GGDEF domain-containing protein [Candidatus Delongbacteria bacterium]